MQDEFHLIIEEIIEYTKLEGTHMDHQIQLLATHRIPQKSHRMSESIVQTLLELQHAQCCEHFPGENVPVPQHPPDEEPSPDIQPEPLMK